MNDCFCHQRDDCQVAGGTTPTVPEYKRGTGWEPVPDSGSYKSEGLPVKHGSSWLDGSPIPISYASSPRI
jgi:hypothetical protein